MQTSQYTQSDIGTAYLEDVLRNFRSYKKLAEEAFAQTGDEDMFRLIDPEANSIAMLVKHMAGNMRSRWTDFSDQRRRKAGPASGPGVRNRSRHDSSSGYGVVGARMAICV